MRTGAWHRRFCTLTIPSAASTDHLVNVTAPAQEFAVNLPDSGAVSTHSFQELWDDFADFIENDKPSSVNIEVALKAH